MRALLAGLVGCSRAPPTLPSHIPLTPGALLVGRAPSADIVLDSLRQPKMVSREHAILACEEDDGGRARWRIEDYGAPNGTAVNVEIVVDSHELANGDVLRFGRKQSEVKYRFCVGS